MEIYIQIINVTRKMNFASHFYKKVSPGFDLHMNGE